MKPHEENPNIMALLPKQALVPTALPLIKEIYYNNDEMIMKLMECFALGEIIGKRKERSKKEKYKTNK